MPILLFIVYAALLSFVICRSAFLARSGLSKKFLVIIFLLYSAVGCAHTLIAYHYFPNHGDVWDIFNNGVQMKSLLLHNYIAFKQEFFPDDFSIDIAGAHLGWSRYQQQPLAALQMIFNFFSGDNIYVNVLLFNFIILFGRIALYRTMLLRYPQRPLACQLTALLIPGVVFWTSVIHKEGLLVCFIGCLVYTLQKLFDRQGSPGKKIVAALIMLAAIFIIRKAAFIALAPALAVWCLSEWTTLRLRHAVAIVAATSAIFFVFMGFIDSSYSLLYQLSSRQHEFMKLHGGSRIVLPPLTDGAASFTRVLPYALFNGLLMPLPGTGGQVIYNLFSVEILLLMAIALWSVGKKKIKWDGFLTGCLVFGVAGCLLIGYTVPFVGAIVRYRSVFFPFLLAPFLLTSNHPVPAGRGSRSN